MSRLIVRSVTISLDGYGAGAEPVERNASIRCTPGEKAVHYVISRD